MSQNNSLKPVHVFTVGKYGMAMAKYLKMISQDIVETPVVGDIIPLPEVWPDSRATVVLSWRPVPTLCEYADEISHLTKRPFIPVIQDANELQVGPVVIPGHGSCWRCWVKRGRQRSEWPEAKFAVLQHYANHPASGPVGFLDSFALIAAARVKAFLDCLESQPEIAGSVWQINVLSRAIVSTKVVGTHGCPQCGISTIAAIRTIAAIQQQLAYLWTQSEGRS